YRDASSLVVAQYVLETSRAPYGLLVDNQVTAEWLSALPRPAVALLSTETANALTAAHQFALERASAEVDVRGPAASLVRNIPSGEMLESLDTPKPMALYWVLPSAWPAAQTTEGTRTILGEELADGWKLTGWRSSADQHDGPTAPDGTRSLGMTFAGA